MSSTRKKHVRRVKPVEHTESVEEAVKSNGGKPSEPERPDLVFAGLHYELREKFDPEGDYLADDSIQSIVRISAGYGARAANRMLIAMEQRARQLNNPLMVQKARMLRNLYEDGFIRIGV